ncbi:MAG: RecQ family ATP-dependent DNA helicase [Flavobacteriales bacterium]|nr:RecQ family ATP-dependent DNA helicase [Flavobacteriales bacterium]
MGNIHEILDRYWGYNSFRPMQENIINSVLEGNDTLALLPTGGGKSICFQVPALANEGICIVISPLIALMKDQVLNLKKRGINAAAIYSGMSRREIDILLDNCIYGDIKFLYVSPERLTTELFIVRFQKMNVNLIAVDESHCISQWGYDFRPSYLQISDIGTYFPDVPVMALTATATPEVVIDIQEILAFKTANVLQKSFERKNIAYVVQEEEDKHGRLLKIVNKVPGTGVVYVRNRRKTEEIAIFLQKNGIHADFYHAGLDSKMRDTRQESWINNKTRIIVSTNAFGMGIDKSNVRFVVHLDLTDSLEAYFQEAGRGGRDEKKAYAIQLYSKSDIITFKEQTQKSFPPLETIKKIYQALGNYFQLAVGSGKEESFTFNLGKFCNGFKFNQVEVYNSLKYIEKEGYLTVSDSVYEPGKLKFIVGPRDIQNYQENNSTLSNFIKVILRSYSGVFDNYKIINEGEIANRCGIRFDQVKNLLELLQKQKVIDYIPQNYNPSIYYNEERLSNGNLKLSKKNYEERKEITLARMNSVINYVTHPSQCRSKILLSYFGEKETSKCGQCDVCLKEKRENLASKEYNQQQSAIKSALKTPLTLNELIETLPKFSKKKLVRTIQWLMDNERVVEGGGKLYWNG